MIISLIAALPRNRALGKNNMLLWTHPTDMQHFRTTTRGKAVIMGRKTWESLPPTFRPLPGRHNIVISHNSHYDAHGATLVSSLEEALNAAAASDGDELFIIGGAQLYAQALPLSQRLYLTEIDGILDGDAFFPPRQPDEWQELSRTAVPNPGGLPFSLVLYQRHGPHT